MSPTHFSLRPQRLRRPSSSVKFLREFALGDDVEVKGISAKHDDGVLRVTVPRVAPPPKEVVTVAIQ